MGEEGSSAIAKDVTEVSSAIAPSLPLSLSTKKKKEKSFYCCLFLVYMFMASSCAADWQYPIGISQ